MKSILVELTCRECMYHTYRKSETLILSDFETLVRVQLLEDTFFALKCPRCGNLIEFIHPLAYIDKKHKFILLIKSKSDFKEEDHLLYIEELHSKKRFISQHQDIPEKIRIFEDDLDDRVIEILKFKLIHHIENQRKEPYTISYQDYEPSSQTLWFTITNHLYQESLAVPYNEYIKVDKEMSKDPHNRYLEVNSTWVFDNYIK